MSRSRTLSAGLAGLSGLAAFMAPVAALADAPPSPSVVQSGLAQSPQQANPADRTQTPRQAKPQDVFSGPSREDCQLSDDPALAFDFHEGVIDDPAKVLSERDKQAAWSDSLGQRITPRTLCEIRDRLATRIFRRGVLARVIIPPQTISSGKVTFRVIAAKIVSVRFDGDDIGPVQAKVEAYLNHLRRRDTFDLDTAQRWLLLVNDIPGVQATARIVHSVAPGAPAEGLDLLVTIKRVAINEFGEITNANSGTLGPWSGVARADLNGFTAFGEHTSIIAYTTLGNNRQEAIQLIESAKVGDSGLFAQASFSFGHSRPGDELKTLDLTGNSYVGSFEVDYPLIRLQRESLTLSTGFDLVSQTTTFSSGQPLSDDTLRVVWAQAAASATAADRPVLDNYVTTATDVSFQVRKGLEILGASEPGAQNLSRTDGRADGWVLRGESHASLRITPMDVKYLPVTFSLHFIGQWADRPLLAYEQQGIGNLTIGRGYDPNAASGERVAAGELKIEFGPKKLWRAVTVTPYVFDDLMYVGFLEQGQTDVTLRSVGGGLQFRIPYDKRGDVLRIDAGYAKPLDKPIPSDPHKPSEEYLLQVVIAH